APNADEEGSKASQEARQTSAARARCPGGQRFTASHRVLPQSSRGNRPPGTAAQRRARFCPGADERPPSSGSASRGERLAHRAGAPAAASACPEQRICPPVNEHDREIEMSAARRSPLPSDGGGISTRS